MCAWLGACLMQTLFLLLLGMGKVRSAAFGGVPPIYLCDGAIGGVYVFAAVYIVYVIYDQMYPVCRFVCGVYGACCHVVLLP